jgi:ABC-2 type transport system permease protein
MTFLLRKLVLLMNKFWVVLSHTFTSQMKTKSYIITTLVTAIIVAVIFNLPSIFALFDDKKAESIGVVDATGKVFEALDKQLAFIAPDEIRLVSFATEDDARKDLDREKIKGYLWIQSLTDGKIEATYKSMKITDGDLINPIEQGLNQVQFRLMANNMGISEQQAATLFQTVDLKRVPLDENAKSEEELVQSTVLVYILLFAIYFAVLLFGNMVAMEVAKEKSSRIMEILVSSVNPITQMYGKILGIGLLGIFQMAVYVAVGYVSMQFGDKTVNLGDMVVDFSNIPVSTVVYGVIFFILGYFLFSTLAAMLGSIVSRVEELQQVITPLTLLVVAAFMIAMFGLNTPDAPHIVVTSFIPIFTPMIMFLRIGLSNPALWEIILSIALLIATIAISAIFAAKVYRGGVLMYGKSATLKDLGKAIKVYKEQ